MLQPPEELGRPLGRTKRHPDASQDTLEVGDILFRQTQVGARNLVSPPTTVRRWGKVHDAVRAQL